MPSWSKQSTNSATNPTPEELEFPWCSQRNRRIVEQELLKHAAKVDESGEGGETGVMWAVDAGKLGIFKRLIETAANLLYLPMAGIFGYGSWTRR